MTDDDPVYLDHNATTPVAVEVVEAMRPWLAEGFGNPSSSHVYGQRAKAALEAARTQVAEAIGAEPGEILFTSGGTESNNLAIRGLVSAVEGRTHVLTSTIEHPATVAPCRHLETRGFTVSWAPVDIHGRLRIDDAVAMLRPDTALVTIMHANNETGTLQPVTELACAARELGAYVHTDAAQSVGKVPVDVTELGVHLLSIAGHKLYAPKGVGALFVRRGTPLAPLVLGAGQERGLRPGTENVAYAVGLGRACELARERLAGAGQRMAALCDRLWRGLAAEIDGLLLNGHPELRLPNTLNLSFPRARGADVLERAPGLAASTGSACHDGLDRPSEVLTAMGVDDARAMGSVRLSLGRSSTEAHVDTAIAQLARAFRDVSGP